MSKSKLATEVYKAYSGNYTLGRTKPIRAITIHHMAGKMTAKQCGAIFQRVGRNGSSHYGIGYNGEIANYVDENDTAWTNSNWDSNCESVTIETSNDVVGGDWHVSDKSLESLIKLVADISIRNNLGKLVKGKNLTWHQLVADKKYPTACPGPYLISKLDYIIEKANEIIEPKESKVQNLVIEDIPNKKVRLKINANLWNLDFTKYADAKAVKSFKKGDVIIVSAIATHPLGSKYYLTEYSFTRKINNGFNVVDCEDYVEEVIHTVNYGENLSVIAKKYNTTWQKIYNDNKSVIGPNPNIIQVGMKLVIK